MKKEKHTVIAMILFFLWTAGILYGSLAPGEDLPPMGWLARIPHYDKLIHFGFYLGQVVLLSLWIRPACQNRIWVAIPCIIFSGIIELLQSEYFSRSGDWIDFAANSFGALLGVPLAVLIIKVFGGRGNSSERENTVEHNEL